MKENCASGVLSDIVTEVYDNFFNTINKSEVSKLCKQKFIYEKVDKYSSDDFIALEFFGIPKNLKRIEPYEIDYITIKMKDIRSNNDKLMLITHAYSKQDIIQYYIKLLSDGVHPIGNFLKYPCRIRSGRAPTANGCEESPIPSFNTEMKNSATLL